MLPFPDQENIIFCINCDAEYTLTKIDDDEQEPEFCPYCGYHLVEDEDDEDDDIEEEEKNNGSMDDYK
jgi:hypothetical protein